MPRPKKEKVELDLSIYTKSGKLRRRKRKQSRNYFTQDTEDGIGEYLAETDGRKRNEIFNEKVYHSFFKLTENIIHTYKFYHTEVDSVEQLQTEIISFLLQKLHLYDKNKGKAFSYFGTITKRWLIVYDANNFKRLKEHADLSEVDENKTVFINLVNSNAENELIEFVDKFVAHVESRMNTLFEKEIDRKTGEAILEVFRKRENLEVINKQAFYLYVKEITGNTAPQITKVVKVLKDLYRQLMNQFYLEGDIYI